jgi:hypothetical protein
MFISDAPVANSKAAGNGFHFRLRVMIKDYIEAM